MLERLTWPAMLSRWDDIETDFHHFYGVDLADPDLSRPWGWFAKRTMRLLAEDTALARWVGVRDLPKEDS